MAVVRGPGPAACELCPMAAASLNSHRAGSLVFLLVNGLSLRSRTHSREASCQVPMRSCTFWFRAGKAHKKS